MPTVPRIKAPSIDSTLTPAPNLSGETFGAFSRPKPVDASAAYKLAGDVYADEREKADQVAVTGAKAQLTALETNLLHGQNGFLSKEGADALKAPDSLNASWQDGISKIRQSLTNDRQKAAFDGDATERYGAIDRQVQEHVATESRKYDASQTEALINNEQDAATAAYTDPDRIKQSIATQVSTLTQFAGRHGMGKEQLEHMVSEAVSSTHVGVIDRMLANDEDIAAQKYFDAHKDQIAGKNIAKLENLLQEGALKGEGFRQSDAIVKKYGDDQNAADSAVKEISDPKLREVVQKNVDYEFQKRRERRRNDEDNAFTSATPLMEAHPGADPRTVLPTTLYEKLSLEQRSALKRYSDQLGGKDGPNGVNADKVWLDFLSMPPGAMGKLTRSELETNYLQYLGKRDRHSAITRWNAAKSGAVGNDVKDNPGLKSAFSFSQMVSQSLTTSRLVTGDKDKKSDEAQLEARVQRRTEDLRAQYAAVKGKDLTSQEERAIIDQVVLEEAFATPGKKTIDVKERGQVIAQVVKEKDGTTRVPYGRVPADERAAIERSIRLNGGQITRDKVERAYAAGVMGDAAAAQRIVKEK